jgi:hypothetical protein
MHKTTRFLIHILTVLLVWSMSACTTAAAPQPETSPDQVEVPAASTGAENGPWLVVQTDDSVDMRQVEGDGVNTLLWGSSAAQPAVFFAHENPDNPSGWFALLDSQTMTLRIHASPGEEPATEIPPLSNPEINEGQMTAFRQVLTSTAPPALAWSPDGGAAVFLAAIDHPSLELYLFDSSNLSVTRLLEGSRDVYQPTWSPDGQWVVYDEIDGLNTIGLWSVTAVKAVRANASQTVTLYEPLSYAEPRLGWSSPDAFIVHSARDRGPVDMREVSLESGKASPIFNGVFSSPAYDPASGQAFFILSDNFNDADAQPPGIYRASKTRPPELLSPGTWISLEWNAASGVLLAVEEASGAAAINPSGQIVRFAGENNLPTVSAQGDLYAFSGGEGSPRPGLRVYSGEGDLVVDASSTAVEGRWWLPGGQLAYTQGDDLFLLANPSAQPLMLERDATVLGWYNYTSLP